MIHYCTTEKHNYTVERFMAGWGHVLRPYLQTHTYEALFTRSKIPAGVWIFTDLDRLETQKPETLEIYATAILTAGCPVYNQPLSFLKRYPFLRLLFEQGYNQGNVYRFDEDLSYVRYPVFIRVGDDHYGPRTRLIHNQAQLQHAKTQLTTVKQFPGQSLMITEWVDYRNDEGLYKVFSAYRVGREILPCHIFTGHDWKLKQTALKSEQTVIEEREYMTACSHQHSLMKRFKKAGVDFGRIDYGLVGGKIHVFEINTNPSLIPRGKRGDLRLDNQREKHRVLAQSLKTLSVANQGLQGEIVVNGASTRPAGFAYRKIRQKISQLAMFIRYRFGNRSLDFKLD